MMQQAKFQIGQIIQHDKFGYRGVIYEADPEFSLSDAWYDQVAKSRPPRDKPWYHVLVDNAVNATYVAERHLLSTDDQSEVSHPDIDLYFTVYQDGFYHTRQQTM